MEDDAILYHVEGRIGTITLNRPHVKNALDVRSLQRIVEVIRNADEDSDVWILVIRASGNDFCVGQDVKEILQETGGDFFEPVFLAFKSFYKPVVSAVRGLCLAGGAGIVMGSDIRVLSTTARMGWPHTKIGLCSIGGPSSLARMVPINVALELMFTADLIDAEKAAAYGLANHVVADDSLDSEVEHICEKLLRNAPLAVRAAKEATLSTMDVTYSEAVQKAHLILDRLLESRDAKEGMQAFMEKRAPIWEGR